VAAAPATAAAAVVVKSPRLAFGEETNVTLTNFEAINFASGETLPIPDSLIGTNEEGGFADEGVWEWLKATNMDLAFINETRGFYLTALRLNSMTTQDRDEFVKRGVALASLMPGTDLDVARYFGRDPEASLSTTNMILYFKTREGSQGQLQVNAYSDDPPSVTFRYKLGSADTNAAYGSPVNLHDRLEAAVVISNSSKKDSALSSVAVCAADMGQAGIVKEALSQMVQISERDDTARQAVHMLAMRGQRHEALEIAKTIGNAAVRDATLADLAQ
jgi:hypothetical protein